MLALLDAFIMFQSNLDRMTIKKVLVETLDK